MRDKKKIQITLPAEVVAAFKFVTSKEDMKTEDLFILMFDQWLRNCEP